MWLQQGVFLMRLQRRASHVLGSCTLHKGSPGIAPLLGPNDQGGVTGGVARGDIHPAGSVGLGDS